MLQRQLETAYSFEQLTTQIFHYGIVSESPHLDNGASLTLRCLWTQTDRTPKSWGEGTLTATIMETFSLDSHFCFPWKRLLGHLWPTAKRSWCNCREQCTSLGQDSAARSGRAKLWQGWKTALQFSWGREQNFASALDNASGPMGEGGGLRWG